MDLVAIRDLTLHRGLVGGPFGSNLVGSDYVANGVPVIRGSNMGPVWVEGDFAFVSDAKADADLAGNLALPGDLVFTQRGTLGQVAMVPSGAHDRYVISQSQMRLRVDPSVADARYVQLACRTKAFLKQVSDHAISTGVPHINLGILGGLTIPKRGLQEQREIAEVLGALDDKIAANERVAMHALALADAEFSIAQTSAGAAVRTYADVANVGGGGTPKTAIGAYWGGDINWATPTDITALAVPYLKDTSRKITAEGLAACSSPLYPVGSILMTSRATIGAFALAETSTAVNQGFIVVNAVDPIKQMWLFHDMRSRTSEFVSHANGATFLELSRGKFKQLPFTDPEPKDAAAFDRRVRPLHDLAAHVATESSTLAAARDALLPPLMWGKLRVKDVEKQMEEVR